MKTYDFAFRTAQGGRDENQDFGACEKYGDRLVLIVCDGMGGAKGGRVAAALTTESILDYLDAHLEQQEKPTGQLLAAAIQYANQFVWKEASTTPSYTGMGTTLAVVIIEMQQAVIVHVGDSRVYQFRKGERIFRTEDHSKVRELENQGRITEEQARGALAANVITRAIGICPEVEIELDTIALQESDLLLLCTDGVWGAVGEEKMLALVRSSTDVNELADRLMFDADSIGLENNRRHDNMTVALAKINAKLKRKPSRQRLIMVILIILLLFFSLLTSLLR